MSLVSLSRQTHRPLPGPEAIRHVRLIIHVNRHTHTSLSAGYLGSKTVQGDIGPQQLQDDMRLVSELNHTRPPQLVVSMAAVTRKPCLEFRGSQRLLECELEQLHATLLFKRELASSSRAQIILMRHAGLNRLRTLPLHYTVTIGPHTHRVDRVDQVPGKLADSNTRTHTSYLLWVVQSVVTFCLWWKIRVSRDTQAPLNA